MSELHDLVASARRDVLDEDAVARMRARLAAGAVATSATGVAASKTARTLALKPLAFGGLAVGVAAVAFVVAMHRPAPTQTTRGTFTPETKAAVEIPVVAATPSANVELTIAQAEPMKTAPTALPQRTPEKTPRALATVIATATATATPTPTTASSPREGLLLLRARAVVASDPVRALALVREHAAEFPDSQLAPEREKIRLLAKENGAR